MPTTIQSSNKSILFGPFSSRAARIPAEKRTLAQKLSSCSIGHVVGGGITAFSIGKFISSIFNRDSSEGWLSSYLTPITSAVLGVGVMLFSSNQTRRGSLHADLVNTAFGQINQILQTVDPDAFFSPENLAGMKSATYIGNISNTIYQKSIDESLQKSDQPFNSESPIALSDELTDTLRAEHIKRNSHKISRNTIWNLFANSNFKSQLNNFLTNLNEGLGKLNCHLVIRPSQDYQGIEMILKYKEGFVEPENSTVYNPILYKNLPIDKFIPLFNTHLAPALKHGNSDLTLQTVKRAFAHLFVPPESLASILIPQGMRSLFLKTDYPRAFCLESGSKTSVDITDHLFEALSRQPWFTNLTGPNFDPKELNLEEESPSPLEFESIIPSSNENVVEAEFKEGFKLLTKQLDLLSLDRDSIVMQAEEIKLLQSILFIQGLNHEVKNKRIDNSSKNNYLIILKNIVGEDVFLRAKRILEQKISGEGIINFKNLFAINPRLKTTLSNITELKQFTKIFKESTPYLNDWFISQLIEPLIKTSKPQPRGNTIDYIIQGL